MDKVLETSLEAIEKGDLQRYYQGVVSLKHAEIDSSNEDKIDKGICLLTLLYLSMRDHRCRLGKKQRAIFGVLESLSKRGTVVGDLAKLVICYR